MRSIRQFVAPVLATAALSIVATTAFAQTPVTACGQEVSGSAALAADLDCTGFIGNAVTVHGGTLALNGHTITGGDIGVYCDRRCSVVGPGLVTGGKYFDIDAFGTSVHVKQVDVTNAGVFGVQSWKSCVIDGPATMSGNGAAVATSGKTKVRGGVTISGNGTAISANDNHGTGSVIVTGSTITGNGWGITTQHKIKLIDATVTDNGRGGLVTGEYRCPRKTVVKLVRSTVTGNDTDASCGTTNVCADITGCGTAPKLDETSTCEHSYVNGSGNPGDSWHVCTLD